MLETKMASCSGKKVEAVERREGLLVEQRGHFAVNFPIQGAWETFQKCKLWEEKCLGADNSEYGGRKSKLQRTTWAGWGNNLSRSRESGNHWHSLFASVVTTTVFREMTEKNAHFTGKLQRSKVTGLVSNVHLYATSSSSGKADWKILSLLWARGFCCYSC